jgi:hypothetical protein
VLAGVGHVVENEERLEVDGEAEGRGHDRRRGRRGELGEGIDGYLKAPPPKKPDEREEADGRGVDEMGDSS